MASRRPLLITPIHYFRQKLGFRLIHSSAVAGTKVLESFSEEFEIGSKKVVLETGKIARFANGSVVLGIEETKVLSAVASAKADGARDFLPLTVDYQEKQFAQGVIPNTFMRREGAPKERELLCGRLIDRPIRPLFPKGFYHDVQVTASVLSSDGKQDPDIMAANATSTALMLSDIPWGGPIGVIRIGRISGQFIVNPSMDELNLSDLNLVYACTKDKTLMLDVQARGISERDLESAFRLAHPEAVKFLEPQIRLAAKAGKKKKEYTLSLVSERTMEKVRNLTASPIEAVFTDPTYGKFERGEALDNIMKGVRKELEEECDEESLKFLPKTVDTVRKEVVRKRIIAEGLRVDGRRLDEVRPIYCEAGNLPQLHGSSLFSRGDTQVLCTVTLGAPGQAQRLEAPVGPPTKRFMLHYSFPPFCINEVGKRTGLNRREVGHGTLAEKALLAVIPPEDDLRYTIRINSEVMASDGSTSMATVCGGSLALMDAGIPLTEHVAGVSVGLVSEVDPSTGAIKDYRIVTDILGLEDHLGDMDFKIAGTRNGITAIQLDIKPAGIPLDIICESLEPALKARLQILDHMEREISVPRTQDERNSPRIVTMKYSNEAIRRLVGPLGALKRKIEEETGARISVSDGSLTIVAKNKTMLEKVLEKVDYIIGREIEVGGVYKGTVTSIKEYGAFVEFNGGQTGLLHISELSYTPVARVADMLSIGQLLSLKCIGQDLRGNIKLSLKETLPRDNSPVKCNDIEDSSVHIEESNIDFALHDDMAKIKLQTAVEDIPESKKLPSITIRSAAECDEEEKSAKLINKKAKKLKKLHTAVEDCQEREDEKKTEKASSCSPSPPIVIRSASECDEKEKTVKLILKTAKGDKKLKTAVDFSESEDEKSEIVSTCSSSPSIVIRSASECDEEEKSAKLIHKTAKKLKKLQSEKDDTKQNKNPISAKTLKLGSKLKAKVDQVRARGLVLDLGGGLRGMHRFEDNATKEYQVGDELVVKCTSFTTKGIPVMSILEDKK